jgi:predicted RND superfamily exporter protein
LADFVPTGQEDKLEIISDIGLFLAPSLNSAQQKDRSDDGADSKALDALIAKLADLAEANVDEATRKAAARLTAAVRSLPSDDAVRPEVLSEMRRRLLSGLPGRLAALRQSLEAAPVTIDDLPEAVKGRQIAEDGQTKVTVYPKDNVRDHDALRRFVAAVRAIAPTATGSPVVILEAGNAVVRAFRDAAVIAVLAIGFLLVILLRRVRDVILVFAPLALAAVLTVAASVLFELPFNFANVIVLPLLFGLGVASGIHLVTRERDAAAGHDVMRTSTPRAVVFSALTTIGSFGSIALSSHPGTSSMGTLLTIAIALTLACTLIVLPALMAIWRLPESDAVS